MSKSLLSQKHVACIRLLLALTIETKVINNELWEVKHVMAIDYLIYNRLTSYKIGIIQYLN